MSEFPADDFNIWRDLSHADVRDIKRFIHQLKNAKVITQDGREVPLLRTDKSDNAVFDLRNLAATSTEVPLEAPVLTLTVDDPNQELDNAWTLPTVYDAVFLERGLDGEVFAPLVELAGTAAAYEDGTATPGTTYYYRVRGIVGGAYSPWSNVVSGELTAPPPPPPGALDLYATGENDDGELGLGDSSNRSSFEQLGTPDTFLQASSGQDFAIYLRSDKTIWFAGSNASGEQGTGSNGADVTTLTQVGTDTDWEQISAGRRQSYGIKTDGGLYAWGDNTGGQCGFGFTSGFETPGLVDAGPWLMISGSAEASNPLPWIWAAAIKSDGTLWLLPVSGTPTWTQVGSATNWTKVSAGSTHIMALNSAGEVWGMGINRGTGTASPLGIGFESLTNTPEPLTQEASLSTAWTEVVAGRHYSIAKKSDGTIWSTGAGTNGRLGLGSTTSFTTFQQIGSDTDWDTIGAGWGQSGATKTDGTLYTWGWGNVGQLGDGGSSDVTSPTQIGSDTDHEEFIACANRSFVLRTP